MITVDLHSHTLYSGCGCHTVIEMLTHAKSLGMKALAITDHTPLSGGHVSSPFHERLKDPVPGIKLLKGMEINPEGKAGQTDIPLHLVKYMDVVLMGLHANIKPGMDAEYYTALYLKVIEANPFIDIISHPNNHSYPVDFNALARECAERNIALELNNSKTLLNRVSDDITVALLESVKAAGCGLTVNSDAHALNEVGRDESVRPLLEKVSFPEALILNRDEKHAFQFIELCRSRKTNGPEATQKIKAEYRENIYVNDISARQQPKANGQKLKIKLYY